MNRLIAAFAALGLIGLAFASVHRGQAAAFVVLAAMCLPTALRSEREP